MRKDQKKIKINKIYVAGITRIINNIGNSFFLIKFLYLYLKIKLKKIKISKENIFLNFLYIF